MVGLALIAGFGAESLQGSLETASDHWLCQLQFRLLISMQEVNSRVPVQADTLGESLANRSAETAGKLQRESADLQEQLSSSFTRNKDLELQVQELQQLTRSAGTLRPIPHHNISKHNAACECPATCAQTSL